MRGEAGLLADLETLAIPFTAHEHIAVFTVAESDAVNADIAGAHTKNLFLKDAGGSFWLVTVPSDARVDLKALPAAIGCKRVSFGKADDMQRLLGIEPGAAQQVGVAEDAGQRRAQLVRQAGNQFALRTRLVLGGACGAAQLLVLCK